MTVNDTAALGPTYVIDADTHLTEPADLWTSRAPKKYVDLVPRVVEAESSSLIDGESLGVRPMWVVGKDIVLGRAGGGSVIDKRDEKVKGIAFTEWSFDDTSAAASFVEPRLAIMEKLGVWAQIVYPNVVGFGGQSFGKIPDLELRLLIAQIWNDVMAEYQETSGQRMYGMALVPWWDIDVAVAEITRASQLGLRGVNLCSDPQEHGMPDLASSYWDPMWSACADAGLPVNFHIGASASATSWFGPTGSSWASMPRNNRLAIGSATIFLGNSRVLANMILGGVLERHPTLKVVSVESGIGWIPFYLEALDYQADEADVEHLSMLPSEYFARQMYGCFWFESRDVIGNIRKVGVDRCMFETDFPHPTCFYPNPIAQVTESLSDLSAQDRAKVLGGNAARLYNIPMPGATAKAG